MTHLTELEIKTFFEPIVPLVSSSLTQSFEATKKLASLGLDHIKSWPELSRDSKKLFGIITESTIINLTQSQENSFTKLETPALDFAYMGILGDIKVRTQERDISFSATQIRHIAIAIPYDANRREFKCFVDYPEKYSLSKCSNGKYSLSKREREKMFLLTSGKF